MSGLLHQIGPRGASQLAEALRVNKSLTELDLRENSLGPEGMKSIAQALAGNESIRSLHLQVNRRFGFDWLASVVLD